MENNLEVNTEFLNSKERKNSKTFYYLRMVIYHNIPLLVHSDEYKMKLLKQCYEIIKTNVYMHERFRIYSVQDRYDYKKIQQYMESGVKIIIDNEEVRKLYEDDLEFSLLVYHGGAMSDDQIREIILSDLVEGKNYYESFDDFLNNLNTSEPKEMRQIREEFEFDLKKLEKS